MRGELYVLVAQATARIEHFRRTETGWAYTSAGPGERLTTASGAVLDVDAIAGWRRARRRRRDVGSRMDTREFDRARRRRRDVGSCNGHDHDGDRGRSLSRRA